MNSLLFALVRRRCAIISAIIIFCLLPVFGGCDFPTANQAASAQQDFQTTQFRYLNMTNLPDSQLIQAVFSTYSLTQRARVDTTITGTLVAPFNASSFLPPRADSGRIIRVANQAGQALYTLPPYLFTNRNARYTFVGLPTGSGTKLGIDTVIALTSLPSDTVGNVINIRIVNCINEPRKTYSFNIGCPSGTPLGGALAFRRSSGVVPVTIAQGGVLSLALTEQSTTASGIVSVQQGLFTLQPLRQGNSYTLLLYKDVNANIQLLGINERSPERLMVQSTTAPLTYLRVANFAANAIANVRYGQNEILRNIAAGTVSSYQSATACAAVGRDTLTITRSQGTLLSQQLTTSLEVNGSQTLFVSDSTAVTVPASVATLPMNMVGVRVVNLSADSISVVRGATTQQRAQQIAPKLLRGAISATFSMPRGDDRHPFIVFSANSAGQLLQHSISNTLISGISSYFLVVYNGGMALVPDVQQTPNTMPFTINTLEQGVFVQAINAFGEMTTATITLGTVVRDVEIGYGSPVLTVLPREQGQTISMGNVTSMAMSNFRPEPGLRYVVIGSGNGASRKLLTEQGLWTPKNSFLRPSHLQSSIRYFNATSHIERLRVRNTESDSPFIVETPLIQHTFTEIQRYYSNRTRTLVFQNDTIPLFTARNLTFLYGNKGYTVIFTGRAVARDTVYNALVLQEY